MVCAKFLLNLIHMLSPDKCVSIHFERLHRTIMVFPLIFEREADFLIESIKLHLSSRFGIYQPFRPCFLKGLIKQLVESMPRETFV